MQALGRSSAPCTTNSMLDSKSGAEVEERLLEELIVGNADLEELKTALAEFNLFEAIGITRQELRHSNFLGFLLSPQENHGIGDAFVTRLLQKAIQSGAGEQQPVSAIDLDLWSLDDLTVLREWQNIDILLLSGVHRLAIIIENKIGSHEHSDQLARYYGTVSAQYPDWKIIGLYLTPEGGQPSDPRYIGCSYGLVSATISDVLSRHSSPLAPGVSLLLEHYNQLLQRHVVSENKIADLCRRIYQGHKPALDLIYEHRPDRDAAVRDLLDELIARRRADLIAEYSTKKYIRFAVKDWDVPALQGGSGWVPSGCMLLFEFENDGDSLRLKLTVGPGPASIREKIVEIARVSGSPFEPPGRTIRPQWQPLYILSIYTSKTAGGRSFEELKPRIDEAWEQFLRDDLPRFKKAIAAEMPLHQTEDPTVVPAIAARPLVAGDEGPP